MSGERFELDPMADRRTRAVRVAELRDRIRNGTYHVSSALVAEAIMRAWHEPQPEGSSCPGPDADAHWRWS